MSNKIKKILTVSAVAVTGMYCLNRLIDYTAGLKELLNDSSGEYYTSRQGKIFYTKRGKGTPVVLIHDLHPASSGAEWDKITKKLERNYTVYTLDLIGCGRSDKPWITYTNYLYVQILNEFLENVVKEPAHIVATGLSGSFALMGKTFQQKSYKKIVLVNPVSLSVLEQFPTRSKKIAKYLLELPIIGTTIYNFLMSEKKIHSLFADKYFYHPTLVSGKLEDVYFEAAHKSKSAGRYLLASVGSSYLNANVSGVIRKMDELCIISSRGRKENVFITNDYLKKNKNIEITHISNSKYLPQLEVPEKFYEALSMFLKS
ncbi:MAG: alpha/beta fold hydrolase [Roseburia sp.]